MRHVTASCQCCSVKMTAIGAPDRVGICHCMDCRKHHGAPFYAAAIFPSAAVSVEGETQSYKGRHFCPLCGSSVFARTRNEIEIYLGTFDEPDIFSPTYECWTMRRESWLPRVTGAEQFERNRVSDD